VPELEFAAKVGKEDKELVLALEVFVVKLGNEPEEPINEGSGPLALVFEKFGNDDTEVTEELIVFGKLGNDEPELPLGLVKLGKEVELGTVLPLEKGNEVVCVRLKPELKLEVVGPPEFTVSMKSSDPFSGDSCFAEGGRELLVNLKIFVSSD